MDELYRLKVRLTTTSDWTAATFDNAPVWWVEDQRVVADTRIEAERPLRVHKAPYDQAETVLDAEVILALPAEGDLEVSICRGDIGQTRVELEGVAELSHGAKTGEPTNRRSFRVSADTVRARAARLPPPAPKGSDKLVLAFYYPWYGTPAGPSQAWVHWTPEGRHASTNTPRLGLYDSLDEGVLRQHVLWAKEAGVDGFIASWWGRGSFEDRALRALMKVAEREGLLVTAYHEQADSGRMLRDDLDALLSEHGGSRAWLKAGGKPVVFVYGRTVDALGAKDIAGARGEALLMLDTLDIPRGRAGGGLHTYNPLLTEPATVSRDNATLRRACGQHGLIFAATVGPGFDDTVIRAPGGRRDREDGAFYDRSWERALAADPDWVLICSWNEWHEGSEIEPSLEHGDLALRQTARWARTWKERP